jgi:small GTP-binding protein
MIPGGQTFRDAKVVMLGSQSVGKTSIVNRFIRDSFGPAAPTVGAVFLSKTVAVGDVLVKLQIWDTGGSERYRSMAPMYFHDAHAVIIVYDLTIPESFSDVEGWLRDLYEEGPEHIVIALVGNKCDLTEMRSVSTEAANALAEKKKIPIQFETSANTGENVKKLFETVAAAVLNTGLDVGPGKRHQRQKGPTDGDRCAC